MYCGIAKDPQKRLAKHNSGRGSRYVRARRPAVIAYLEEHPSMSAALKREARIKRMTRGEKLALVSPASSSKKS